MKWRGRRQTTNIIDIRGVSGIASFNISWGDSGTIVIDTDGSIYGSISNSSTLNISLVIPNPPTSRIREWMPTMTIGQKNTLRELVQIASSNTVIQNVSAPTDIDDVVLVQYVQSLINNGKK